MLALLLCFADGVLIEQARGLRALFFEQTCLCQNRMLYGWHGTVEQATDVRISILDLQLVHRKANPPALQSFRLAFGPYFEARALAQESVPAPKTMSSG